MPKQTENQNITFSQRLNKKNFDRKDLALLLAAEGNEKALLFEKAREIKNQSIGNKVYFRGLVEFSNICTKNCYYCGIRKDNKNVARYALNEEQILQAARFAYENHYGSIVLQSGECNSPEFIKKIDNVLRKIKHLSNGKLGITLSIGEQTPEVYRQWFESGAHRYLLRIESSNPELYQKIHPNNAKHDYYKRLQALKDLQDAGYQTGTGVMIGLPFQTYEDLAGDLLFFKHFNIDMVGMGPYIEHEETPLYPFRDKLLPIEKRFDLALKMIACLRILMPEINIAAATALQAITPFGREKALEIGANVIMPNIGPTENRRDYFLYNNKPTFDEGKHDKIHCLESRIKLIGGQVAYNEWGDSKHFFKRVQSS